ncbi:MAG: nucleoside triphosphate pyrophosphohydrolase [Brevefilum sp.]|nr:nucleoside triphosphate pyrophosphohydrolase [Brevefilum sp.]MDW7754811.1 nucleoside triphosphate pyrophosphohydrolase [Brevefilum sp.]
MTQVENRATGITLIGLGPGDPKYLTLEALAWLKQIKVLYLRTSQHPTVAHLPEHLELISFDDLYEKHEGFEEVYEEIIDRMLSLGKVSGGITYAVPGHPFVAEATCPEIFRRAKIEDIPVRVIEGLSFLGPTFKALALDPFPDLVLADALSMGISQTPQTPPSSPVLIAQIYSRLVASDVKLTLMTTYPDDHPVRLVHGAGTDKELVEDLPLYAIDHSEHLGLLSALFVPPLSPYTSFESFQEIIAKLRAPDGCPWDREQTHESLRPFLLEETYETLDALDRQDMRDLKEELGDLLLQILLHAQIANEEGDFNIHHVLDGIGSKLVRRHPHVFADKKVSGVSGVLHNWEEIKAEERKDNGDEAKKGLLDGVPKALPALTQAGEIIKRTRRVGFDYLHNKADPAYLIEQINQFGTAEEKDKFLEDLLLGFSALAYKHEMDAESLLREALARFREQFGIMEASAIKRGESLVNLSKERKEGLWSQAGKAMRKEE